MVRRDLRCPFLAKKPHLCRVLTGAAVKERGAQECVCYRELHRIDTAPPPEPVAEPQIAPRRAVVAPKPRKPRKAKNVPEEQDRLF